MNYYISKTVTLSYDEALSRIIEELKKEGFGVLTEIDVKKTLKKKLDVDFQKYIILGACNPSFAYQALQVENKIGVLLPCNVIIHEHEEGKVEVAALDPVSAMEVINNPKLTEIAKQVRIKLQNVIDQL